jgi:hypothetical protein
MFCSGVTLGQEVKITPGDFNKLVPKLKSGYAYVGEGQFLAFVSCYIVWIEVSFELINFNKSDSILTISGHLYDAARLEKPLLTGTQLIVGKFEIDSNNSANAKIKIKESRILRDSSYFNLELKVTKQDFLCFAFAEDSALDNQSSKKNNSKENSIQIGTVKLYYIGKLLE